MADEPLPPGFVLDEPLPPGFVLDDESEQKPTEDKGMRDLAVALAKQIFMPSIKSAAGVAATGLESLGIPNIPKDISSFVSGIQRKPPVADTTRSKFLNVAGRAAIPTAVGLGAGALLGGPLGAAAGGARGVLGAGAAEAIAGLTGEAAGQTVGKISGGEDISAGAIAGQAALSGTLGAGVKGVTEVAKVIEQPLKSALTSGAQKIMALGKKYGITLSPADITKSKFLSTLESFLEKTPFGSDIITKSRQGMINRLQALKVAASKSLGTRKDAQVIGLALKERVAEQSRVHNEALTELYNQAKSVVPEETFVIQKNLPSALKSLSDKYSRLPPKSRPDGVSMIQDLLAFDESPIKAAGIVGPTGAPLGLPGNVTVGKLMQIRSRLGELISETDAAFKMGIKGLKFQSSVDGGIYKLIQRAIDADLDSFATATGGAFAQKYSIARKAAKAGFDIFQNKNLLTTLAKNPEDIVDFVIKPGAVSEIQAVKAAVKESGFEDIRRAWITKLLQDDPEKAFRPMKLYNDLQKYGEPTLKEIFKHDPSGKGAESALRQLKEIAFLQKQIQTAEGLAGNTSGTGRMLNFGATLGAVGSVGAAATVSLPAAMAATVGAAAATVTPYGLARLYTSDFGRTLLLKGMKTTLSDKAAATKIYSQLASYLGPQGLSVPERQK